VKARSLNAFGVALLLTLSAAPASAQFTAVVDAPKPKAAASQQAVAAATPGATTDSAGQTRLSDMKAWVDSAAGVSAAPTTAQNSDSTARWDTTAARPATPTPNASQQTDASAAPNTATTLPAIAVLGLVLLGSGAALLRRANRT
jgi:hypothetical protein